VQSVERRQVEVVLVVKVKLRFPSSNVRLVSQPSFCSPASSVKTPGLRFSRSR
jgi:hypothetical protein